MADALSSPSTSAQPNTARHAGRTWWRTWWRRQSPRRQDRLALLAPLASVLLFLGALVAALWYLQAEELARDAAAVRRDVEYTQQRLRLRLLERQEQLLRVAAELAASEMDAGAFERRADSLLPQFPELQALAWVDAQSRVRAAVAVPALPLARQPTPGQPLPEGASRSLFGDARDLQQPVYSQPRGGDGPVALQMQIPLVDHGRFGGVLLAEYSLEALLRYGVPPDVMARYAITLRDDAGHVLAGNVVTRRTAPRARTPMSPQAVEYAGPVPPVGAGLMVHMRAYRTSNGVVGSGLLWLVAALTAMTAWLLIATWRHTRRRLQAQEALQEETNFRRAMENSVLIGMRALDMESRITYVNAAYCQMTGYSEAELLGQRPPYPYWPQEDRHILAARLRDELSGHHIPGGFQVRVQRKNGQRFDARLHVSPLIDRRGVQAGWMTSMTDITEPNRIRAQLSASHERFTVVLEALDASVSVAPLGSTELLYANKLYRQWFGGDTEGHLQMVLQAVAPAGDAANALDDAVDDLAGLPTESLTAARTEHAEIFMPALGRWLEVRSRYLNWTDGRLAQMVIATDITPRREAEEAAARQAERAQSVSRLVTMGEMASSVAHELNQPLTAISNYCDGLISRIQGGQIGEEAMLAALEKTARQAQRAGQIIQRIRAFVKKSEPNRTLADVNDMVAAALELAEIELRRRNVRLSHYVAARLPPLLVDPILIEQVLINLIKNAAESIDQAQRPPGKRAVELRVLPRRMEDIEGVEFSVRDTGPGLAPEVLARLFEAFFSTKAEGMGIGLNLCRSIVESHRGRMQAVNLYNGPEVTGCHFYFWIPLGHAGSVPPAAAPPSEPTPHPLG